MCFIRGPSSFMVSRLAVTWTPQKNLTSARGRDGGEMKTKQVSSQLEKIRAAREAFQNWERAQEAAEAAIGDGPANGIIHGSGTCVMIDQRSQSYHPERFQCSECGQDGHARWKFCAFCGAEIIRFDRPEESPKNGSGYITVYSKIIEREETEPHQGKKQRRATAAR